MVLDTETWGGQEFFEVIASRYFELGNEGPLATSWEVRGIDGASASDQLVQLNDHLGPLGMIGALDRSNPPVLSIAGYPGGQFVLGNWHQSIVWILMAGFMTIVGAEWVGRYVSDTGPFGFGVYGQSIVFFTAPIVITLLSASFLRILVSRRFGVETGHIMPIVFPFANAIWPFGVIGAVSQRRTDMVPIPNRRALGLIEVVAPLTLFLTGTALTIIGVSLTSSVPPALEEGPVVFQSNLVTRLLADSWLGDEYAIRLQWLHPTGIAGIGLSAVGWILLLPVPGFPGDRALHSIMGPSEMREGGIQTPIFIAMLGVLVFVLATSEYSAWIFLAVVGAWQRFSPENIPHPLVLDEHAGLNEEFRRGLISMVLIILIAGFPGAMPSSELENFDAGLSTEAWPVEMRVSPGEGAELKLVLEPDGVLPVSGWIQVRVEGSFADQWDLSAECIDSSGICRFSGVIQADKGEVAITITPPQTLFVPHALRILIDVPGNQKEHVIELLNDSSSGPMQPFWELTDDGERPEICIAVNVVGEVGSLNATDPYWQFANGSELDLGESQVCMIGHEGAIQSLTRVDAQNRKIGPEVSFHQENQTSVTWNMAIEGSEPKVQVFEDQWLLPSWFASETGIVINHADSGAPFCPSSGTVAEIDTSSNWTRVMEDHVPIRIIGNLQGNGSMGLGATGWMAVCSDDGAMSPYRIVEGVDVLVHPGAVDEGIDLTEFVVHNRGEQRLSVGVEWHGDSPQSGIWNVSIPSHIEPGASAGMAAIPMGELALARSVWISAEASGITLHLSARCPLSGC